MRMMGDAIKHAMAGMHIFPVNESGSRSAEGKSTDKEPHVTTPPYRIKWADFATRDIRRVIGTWERWPEANIGVACKPSGILVVDCDTAKRPYQLRGTRWGYLHDIGGAMVDGESVYDQVVEKYGQGMLWEQAIDTYRVVTGSGGLHIYYRWPWGVQSTQASIVKGVLDIRGNGGTNGGYVLGAGSETASGTYVPLGNIADIAPAPEWLVEICREQTHATRHVQDGSAGYDRPSVMSYQGLVDAVTYAEEGNRNNALLWAARAMCQDGATQDEALDQLGQAAHCAGLTAAETRDTIRSAYRLQRGKM